MSQNRIILASIAALIVVTGFLFVYLPLPRLESDKLIEDATNPQLEIEAEIAERANGQLADDRSDIIPQLSNDIPNLRFELANYRLVFGEDVELAARQVITSDVDALTNGRIIELVSHAGDRRHLEIQVGDEIATRIYTVDYTPYEGGTGGLIPLSLRDEPQNVSRAFEMIFDLNNEESIYLPSRLIEIYREQIALRQQHEFAFRDLDDFLDRLRNLQSENFSHETIQDLTYRSEGDTTLDTFISSMSIDTVLKYQKDYSQNFADISILNVVPADKILKDVGAAIQLPEDTIVAQVDVYERKNGSISISRDGIQVVYINGNWHIWHPYI